ncbi:hypothetical protein CSKR_204115 [Clonorchis sinensis]|uniref:Uncharacterized protein n=1 Tax=Clonorchis sinensis TaxID=79923 RepID=A0A8T1N2K1_CLOSI|nr:hypothetical protein CSKR_204115 [Clonorchis sinensis]
MRKRLSVNSLVTDGQGFRMLFHKFKEVIFDGAEKQGGRRFFNAADPDKQPLIIHAISKKLQSGNTVSPPRIHPLWKYNCLVYLMTFLPGCARICRVYQSRII